MKLVDATNTRTPYNIQSVAIHINY